MAEQCSCAFNGLFVICDLQLPPCCFICDLVFPGQMAISCLHVRSGPAGQKVETNNAQERQAAITTLCSGISDRSIKQ